MRKVITVFKWEIGKLFSSWQRTVTLFLLPAILLMAALNVFPLLVNYMSTGTLTKKPVTVIDAPESFKKYVEETVNARVFEYDYKTLPEFKKETEDKTLFHKHLRQGMLICYFTTGNPSRDFDDEVRAYYYDLSNDNTDAESSAVIYVGFDGNSITSEARAEQFKEGVLKDYQDSLIDTLGGDYSVVGSSVFETDTFNPITDFEDYRTVANTAAARVVPGVLMIMMYYCVYSLVSDMFASERDRGFMAKLLMTPVSRKHIYAGKIIAINFIVTIATYITMLLMFFSSWINRSNDAMSLLPFGMMLTPAELSIVLVSIPVAVFLMTAICISIVFSLERLQDITVNLQLPLIYFLGDFFVRMVRGTRPITMEYFVPLHNTMELIAETYLAQNKAWHVIVVTLLNLGLALLILRHTFRKEELK
ncbi:ABC transporter permease subunit [Butyrivibrio sp. AE2032]|uniref:ABC transporter permease subunit n=1 Tax=Butyrivibrio sp. AE2032 TaxID=1458463 RepID=UPI00054D34ED|nr:ABC transporter permease subunit [Butyrivibrio sp. AE2032]